MINRMVEITQLGNLHSATLLYVVKLQLSVIAFSPQTCFCPLRFSMYRIIIRDMGDKWLHGGLRISLMGSGRPSCGAYWLNLGTFFQYFLCFPPPKKIEIPLFQKPRISCPEKSHQVYPDFFSNCKICKLV